VSRVRRDLIVLVASLAVFALCAGIVADGRVGSTERTVFHAINGLPGWLYRPMLVAQYLGVLAMPLIVAAGALAFRRWRLAAALVLVVPLKLAAEKVPKQLVERERPGTTVPDAILRGVPRGGLSFVSGHAIITFAIAWAAGAGATAPLGGSRVRAGNLQRAGAGVSGGAQPAARDRRGGSRPGYRRLAGPGPGCCP
jgi:membrane-associated phospholipid phosphatase